MKQKSLIPQTDNLYLWILYLGLLLSETYAIRVLIENRDHSTKDISMFTLIISFIVTCYSLFQLLDILHMKKNRQMKFFQVLEFLGIPINICLLQLLISKGLSWETIICIVFLTVQSTIIIIKIIQIISTDKQLSLISGFSKIFRIIKIFILVLLPLIASIQVYSIASLILQFLSLIVVWKKFTYQLLAAEYYLLIGTICGIISSIDLLIYTLANQPYCYLGQILMIVLWFIPFKPLQSFLEMKYISVLENNYQVKTEEEQLVKYVLLRQCLFNQHKTFQISQKLLSKVTLFFVNQAKKQIQYQQQFYDQQNYTSDKKIFEELENNKKQTLIRLVRIIIQQFKNTKDLKCLVFVIECVLYLQKDYISLALITYYSFQQKKIEVNKILKNITSILHQKIKNRLVFNPSQFENFVQFSDKTDNLNEKLNECLNNQLKLIQDFNKDGKNNEHFPEQKLLNRSQIKHKVKEAIQDCLESSLYIYSNQFKFMFILYDITILKRHNTLKQKIAQLFFSSSAIEKSLNYNIYSLIIIKGSGKGQIFNSNQQFRNNFGIGYKNHLGSTIYDIFPSSKQKENHMELMSEQQFHKTVQKNKRHEDYQCWLNVNRQEFGIKFKAIQIYTISTRIYYEFSQSLNYACELIRKFDHNTKKIQILKKECLKLQQKGIQVVPDNNFNYTQLDDTMIICEITKDKYQEFQSQQQIIKSKNNNIINISSNIIDEGLVQKVNLIQKQISLTNTNILSNCRYWFIMTLAIILIIALSIMWSNLNMNINNYEKMIIYDKQYTRKTSLVTTRMLLKMSMLIILNGTSSTVFPKSMCIREGVTDILATTQSRLISLLKNDYDQFMVYLAQGKMSPQVMQLINTQNFRNGIVRNIEQNITFTKYLNIYKIYFYNFLNTGQSSGISNIFVLAYLPKLYKDSSFENNRQSYGLVDNYLQKQYIVLNQKINFYKIWMCLVAMTTIFFIVVLKLKDTQIIIDYFSAIESSTQEILKRKLKEVNNSISSLKKLKNQKCEFIDIEKNLKIKITVNDTKKHQIYKSLRQFAYSNIEQPDEKLDDQNFTLLNKPNSSNIYQKEKSIFESIILYNKCYMIIIFILLIGIILFCINLTNIFESHLISLGNFDKISEQMVSIQQQYTYLVAYDWANALSLQTGISLASSQVLYTDAINKFQKSNISQLIKQAYPPQFMKNILYGDVCKYFKNQTYCINFRNNIFKNGLSMLLPFTIKDHLDIKNIKTIYSDLFPHLCDVTSILYEGVIPMTETIPKAGFDEQMRNVYQIRPFLLIGIILNLGFLMILVIGCIWNNHKKKLIIREQVLSWDTLSNLYMLPKYQPYFNEIYYS